jgi:hypothetical protein
VKVRLEAVDESEKACYRRWSDLDHSFSFGAPSCVRGVREFFGLSLGRPGCLDGGRVRVQRGVKPAAACFDLGRIGTGRAASAVTVGVNLRVARATKRWSSFR